ncbi:peroxiredoxin-like family protein [Nonomuraea sp. NPDC050328]|uniref:peroxiredoxin-like family protein n=1 Tax=Nonomuraea sp. NPDC050328 TaxID=3364361 RepID=UPI0037AD12B9
MNKIERYLLDRARFAPGDRVTPRRPAGLRGPVALPAPGGLTHLQFRRYAGCPVCNVHLRTFAVRHADLTAAGLHEIAVFHSPAEDLLPHHEALPFDVVADPGKELYEAFGVGRSVRSVLHPRAWLAPVRPSTYGVVMRGVFRGGRPYPRSGENVTGLPADFLLDPDGVLLAVRYGRHAADQWSVEDLLALARSHA